MATKGMDVLTLIGALEKLRDDFFGHKHPWQALNEAQKWFLSINQDETRRVLEAMAQYLKAKASTDAGVLNDFLKASGFEPVVPDPLDGVGAVSILDLLVNWLYEGARLRRRARNGQEYDYFSLPTGGTEVFDLDHAVEGYRPKLVRLATKTDVSVWLMPSNEPATALDLVKGAFAVMRQRYANRTRPNYDFEGVIVPCVSFHLKPSDIPGIKFVEGMDTHDDQGNYWYVDQAFQEFKFGMNEKGARAKVATTVVAKRCIMAEPQPLVFDRPFIGWFTAKDSWLPIAPFYADYDSWKDPGEL